MRFFSRLPAANRNGDFLIGAAAGLLLLTGMFALIPAVHAEVRPLEHPIFSSQPPTTPFEDLAQYEIGREANVQLNVEQHPFNPDLIYRDHRGLVHLTATFIACLILVISLLALNFRRRRKAEIRLNESEERLSTALHAADIGLWDWHIERDKTYFDPVLYTMLGYPPGAFEASIGELIRRIHPEDQERARAAIDDHLDGRNDAYHSEFRVGGSNGEWIWIEARGEVVNYAANGKPQRMIAIHNNVSQRKEKEAQLFRAKSYIRNILDSMPSMIISVDPGGRVTQWNREAEKKTGTNAKCARGKLLSEVLPGLCNQTALVQHALRERKLIRQTKVGGIEAGQSHYSDITVYPLVTDGVDGAVIRIDDATERVRLEEVMIQSEKMISVGGLAAGMAHEINNPLAGILQGTQLLLSRLSGDSGKGRLLAEELELDPEQIRNYLERLKFPKVLRSIHKSGRRAAIIVENILNFSRMGATRMVQQSLPKLIEETLDIAVHNFDLERAYDFRKIEIVRNFAPNLPDIPCDPQQIQQAILNLLCNGAQAMGSEESDRPAKFTLNLRQAETDVLLEVEDNGPGMNAELCKRIFEPFFTTKAVGQGPGLGLSISYFIVTEHHHGSMEVKSNPGIGTCISIRLPMHRHEDQIGND